MDLGWSVDCDYTIDLNQELGGAMDAFCERYCSGEALIEILKQHEKFLEGFVIHG